MHDIHVHVGVIVKIPFTEQTKYDDNDDINWKSIQYHRSESIRWSDSYKLLCYNIITIKKKNIINRSA